MTTLATLLALLALVQDPQPATGENETRALLGSIAGTLVEADGAPVSGCSVAVLQGQATDLLVRRSDEGRTDPLGRFELRLDPRLPAILGFDLDGPLPSLHSVELDFFAGRTVELGGIERGERHRVRGRIVGEGGAGLEGARVRALSPYRGGMMSLANWMVLPAVGIRLHACREPDLLLYGTRERWVAADASDPLRTLLGDLPLPTTSSDAGGHWELEILGSTIGLLLVDHPGRVATVDVLELPLPDANPLITELSRGRTSFGRVTRGGVPVAGAKVWVAALSERANEGFTLARSIGTTRADGTFAVQALPDEDHGTLLAALEPGAEDITTRRFAAGVGLDLELAPEPGSDSEGKDDEEFSIPSTQSMTLRVVAAHSKHPIRNAAVRTAPGGGIVRTNAEGTATIERTVQGREEDRARILIDHAESASAEPLVSDLVADSDGVFVVELSAPSSIRGTILVQGQAPSTPAILEIRPSEDSPVRKLQRARVDARGHFVLHDLAPGSYDYWLLPERSVLPICELPFRGPNDPPTLFEGSLVIPEDAGRPLVVDATPYEARENMSVSGQVRCEALEELSGLIVQAISLGKSYQTRTDDEGRFSLKIARGGKVRLELWYKDEDQTNRLDLRELTLDHEGHVEVDLDIRAQRITFVPVYPDGDLGWYHTLRTFTFNDLPSAGSANAGRDGSVSMLLAGHDRWHIDCHYWAEGLGGCLVDLTKNPEERIEIPMVRCVPCAGTVEFTDGQPLPGEWWELVLILEEAPLPHARGARNGECHVLVNAKDRSFHAPNIVPGRYKAGLEGPGAKRRWSEHFRVDELGNTELVLRFPPRR